MQKIKLSDIASLKMGQSPEGASCNEKGEGIPLLNGPTEFTGFYPLATQHTTNAKRLSQPGDILFCVRGSTTGRMNWSDKEYAIGRGLAAITHKKGKKLNFYLKYLIEYNLKSLLMNTSGSTFPNLTNDLLADFKVLVPELDLQIRISSFLASIDSKIELNNRINAKLEAMAKTLYDYWFVQFDFPDANGKPYKSSGGKMVYHQELKRDIPEGWEVKDIGEACEVIDCLHSKKPDYFESGEKFLLQLENIKDDGTIDISKKYFVTDEDYAYWTSRIVVIEGDLVITNAGRVGAFAQIPNGMVTGIGRNITAIRPKKIKPTYLFYYFGSIDIKCQILKNTDVGAFFKSLNVRGIKKLKVIFPQDNILLEFEKKTRPLRRLIENNILENQRLSELRDWLLPMLMNGQVQVESAEEVLAIAAEPEVAYGK
jgi:type I restriction enzyme, S subunit